MVATQKWGKTKMACKEDTSPLLAKEEKTRIQQIVVMLLYYSRALYPTMLVALGSISENQTTINETTSQAIKQLLDYCATHTDATIIYKLSNMMFRIHSSGLYLS